MKIYFIIVFTLFVWSLYYTYYKPTPAPIILIKPLKNKIKLSTNQQQAKAILISYGFKISEFKDILEQYDGDVQSIVDSVLKEISLV